MSILLRIGTKLSSAVSKAASEDVSLQGQMIFCVNVFGCVQMGALHALLLDYVIFCGVM